MLSFKHMEWEHDVMIKIAFMDMRSAREGSGRRRLGLMRLLEN